MSSIAQKLCEEICEKHSIQSFVHDPKGPLPPTTSRGHKCRPTTSLLVEKKTEINKVLPRADAYRNKVIINKFKSKETLLKKKLVDVASNTRATGPLKCDSDCVTIIRTRDSKCTCARKRKALESHAKEIQTIDFTRHPTLDKASECSFNLGGIPGKINATLKNSSNVKLVYDIDAQTSFVKGTSSKKMHDKSASTPFKTHSVVMGARRWALSTGRIRGPDF